VNRLISTMLCVLLLLPASAAMAGAPTESVSKTVDGVLALLRDSSLNKQQRRDKMRTLINDRFDFRAMSQRTLATNWKKASDEQKERFVKLFGQLIQNSYVGKIEAYTNETVKYASESVKDSRAVVDTFIVTKTVEIPINYKMVLRGSEWKVYDVVIEEVSLVSSYRSSYRNIVKKEGFDGLFAKMDAKIKELTAS